MVSNRRLIGLAALVAATFVPIRTEVTERGLYKVTDVHHNVNFDPSHGTKAVSYTVEETVAGDSRITGDLLYSNDQWPELGQLQSGDTLVDETVRAISLSGFEFSRPSNIYVLKER